MENSPTLEKISLSKSKLMRGLQCEKSLYLSVHHPELEEAPDASTQRRFDEGHLVGSIAQELFPGGALIDAPAKNIDLAIEQTQRAIADGALTIYEATFRHDGFHAKLDILHRAHAHASWEIIEVKSSTRVKEEYLNDLTIQSWIVLKCGLKVKSASLMHINNQSRAPDFENYLIRVDVTRDIQSRFRQVESSIRKLSSIVHASQEPKVEVGPHCQKPYRCPFMHHCWKDRPPEGTFRSPDLIKAWRNQERFLNRPALREFMKGWKLPFYFLDFGVVGSARPVYPGVRPYESVPFQFSCHVLWDLKSKPDHFEFLSAEASEPRSILVEQLIKTIGSEGTIFVYDQYAEVQIFKSLAQMFPAHAAKLRDYSNRLVDLMVIFRSFLYEPEFGLSLGIKKVGSVVLGDRYTRDELKIEDSSHAEKDYLNLFRDSQSLISRDETLQSLRNHARDDTRAMAELVKWFMEQNVSN